MEPLVWQLTAERAEEGQARAARALAAAGLRTGDRFVLRAPPSPEVLLTALGAIRSGVVPVMLNPSLLPEERDVLVQDSQPSLVLDGDGAMQHFWQGVQGAPAHGLSAVPLTRPMHYTSGTTGVPKGVWSGVLDERDALAMFEDERDLWSFTADDRLLICSPLHHSAPLRFAASCLLSGGDVVLVDRFDAGTVLQAIDEHRPTAAFLVPSHLQRLFAHPRIADADLSSFRLLAHAGEPCPPALKERAIDAFPDGSVWEFYGSTEGQFTVCAPEEWRAHPGSVGRARPHRQLSIDDDGTIWCEVPQWARFVYWRDEAKTAAAWRGSAFTVGDLGRLDAEGFLTIDGRRDDLIISGGVNVYPAEVEAALSSTPGAGEVAVFGVDDERWGQRVCAAYTGPAAVAALRAEAEKRLAPYKRPKDYVRVDDLPRTSTGKIRRVAVASAVGLTPS